MSDKSIDSQVLSRGNTVPVRHSFRVPVSNKDNILAIFEGRTYVVVNLSVTGIAVHAESCLDFSAEQILENAELWIGTQRLLGLTGRVIHCTVHASGDLHFGIVWQQMSPENQAQLNKALEKIKSFALKSGADD